MQEGQAHLALGGEASVGVAEAVGGVVGAFDHQVVALKEPSFE